MNNEVKIVKESVQCWAESLAIHLAGLARCLSKADAEALKQLFNWPQMLKCTLPVQILLEKLDERVEK